MSASTTEESSERLHFQPSPQEDLVFKLTGEETGNQLEYVEVTIRPGGGPPEHIHERTDEVLHILEGCLQFKRGEELFELHAGDVVFTPRGVPHAYFNGTEELVVASGVFTPAAGFLEFMQGFQELLSSDSPSPESFKELAHRTGTTMVGPPLRASTRRSDG